MKNSKNKPRSLRKLQKISREAIKNPRKDPRAKILSEVGNVNYYSTKIMELAMEGRQSRDQEAFKEIINCAALAIDDLEEIPPNFRIGFK